MMDEMTYYDDDPTGDDEVTALWDGRLPMDRVLRVLQQEIERRKVAEEQKAKIFELLSNGSAELTAALRWRSVALSLGEAWASHGPDNYYDMTPERWLEWMNETLEKREWDTQ